MAMMTETRMQAISMHRFMGRDIVGSSGSKIGEIDDVILNSSTGCAMFAIVDEGGFLGMGERHHVVPWNALSWSSETNKLMVSFTRDKLANAPLLDRGNPPDWSSETWQRSVYDYFGTQYQSSASAGQSMGGSGGMGGM